jgi:UDP-3-O-[3-hydroxymyristoyl] glucosamine N-acyltransferase
MSYFNETNISFAARIHSTAFVHPTASIGPFVVIEAYVMVGAGAAVMVGATIGREAIVGPGATVGVFRRVASRQVVLTDGHQVSREAELRGFWSDDQIERYFGR